VDRSPLDMIGYMMAEVTMHNIKDPEMSARIKRYMDVCLWATRRSYQTIIACRPLPVYVVEDGKPPPCPAYQWQHQLIVEGAMAHVSDVCRIAYLSTTDHASRVKSSAEMLFHELDDMRKQRLAANIH